MVVSGIRIGGMGRGQAGDLFFILSFSVLFDFCDHGSELLGWDKNHSLKVKIQNKLDVSENRYFFYILLNASLITDFSFKY